MPRHVGFGKESVWDTGVAPSIFMEALSESLAVVQTNIEVKSLRSISTRAVDKSGEHWEGSAEFVANFQELQVQRRPRSWDQASCELPVLRTNA